MPNPILAIVVADGNDVAIYRDEAAARYEMEVIDVIDGAYRAWDAEGSVIELAVRDGAIALVRSGHRDVDALLRVLRRYASAAGETGLTIASPATASLNELMRAIQVFQQR